MMGYFGSKISVWLAALGLVLALVGLLVATGESIRHPERVAPPAGAVESFVKVSVEAGVVLPAPSAAVTTSVGELAVPCAQLKPFDS